MQRKCTRQLVSSFSSRSLHLTKKLPCAPFHPIPADGAQPVSFLLSVCQALSDQKGNRPTQPRDSSSDQRFFIGARVAVGECGQLADISTPT